MSMPARQALTLIEVLAATSMLVVLALAAWPLLHSLGQDVESLRFDTLVWDAVDSMDQDKLQGGLGLHELTLADGSRWWLRIDDELDRDLLPEPAVAAAVTAPIDADPGLSDSDDAPVQINVQEQLSLVHYQLFASADGSSAAVWRAHRLQVDDGRSEAAGDPEQPQVTPPADQGEQP